MDNNIEQDKHEYLNDPSTKKVAKEIRMVMCKYNVWYDVVNVPKVIYQFPATPIICNCKDGNTTSQLVLRNMPFIRFYVARLNGWDATTVFQYQFVKPSKRKLYKNPKSGKTCTKYQLFNMPLPDGIYEVRNMTTKKIHRKFPRLRWVIFYIQFKNGMMRRLSKVSAYKGALGDKYLPIPRKSKYDIDPFVD